MQHPEGQFDHTVLADVLARRWTEARPYFALREPVEHVSLEGSWGHRPGHTGLDLHWSRRGFRHPRSGR